MEKGHSPDIDKKVLRFFSAIADETRLRMLNTLMGGPMTVNGVHEALGKGRMTLSAVSHQLKHLEQSGVVVFEKKGRAKYFRPSPGFCWCILKNAYSHFRGKHECTECRKITAGNVAKK